MYGNTFKPIEIINIVSEPMPFKRVNVTFYVCSRCGHEWISRKPGNLPATCPKCRSPYWNRPRIRHATKKVMKK